MKESNIYTAKDRKISFGDKIFVRLTIGYRTIVETVLDRVSDMTELLGELRHLTQGIRGLAKVYIRNGSQGWATERPLMLYAGSNYVRNVDRMSQYRMQPVSAAASHMPFPWETH